MAIVIDRHKVAIIGYGDVGKSMSDLFEDCLIYDPYVKPVSKEQRYFVTSREEVNEKAEIAFVCVPTPPDRKGLCDTSVVEEVIFWLDVKVIVVCSTVYPGFTEAIVEASKKVIVYEPQYTGVTRYHPWKSAKDKPWIILGGKSEHTALVAQFYQDFYSPLVPIVQVRALHAELAKYMENTWIAAKVSFCNQWYDICQLFGVDYNTVRDIWLMDPRITRSHTVVYPERGFGGKCVPKDLLAIRSMLRQMNFSPKLLDAIDEYNGMIRQHDTH